MSTFVDIEHALAQCGQGQFEKVVGEILSARGVRGLTLLGSVVGKEKTRAGVPDAFASTDGRSFAFFACTTETGARQVESKLLDDVAQCADTVKTGVPVDAIDILYLAFNSALSAGALIRIAKFAAGKGLRVDFLSVSELAGDLSRRFTWIATDFFGIHADTGQILSIDAFVHAYDRGILATPLDTKFLFRDANLSDARDHLSKADLVIKGGAGTGKTRFALELVRQFAARERNVRCILSKGLPVVQDIDRHFCDEGPYLVLLDDANRVNNLDPVVAAIRDRVGEENVRFIFTIRNYAVAEVGAALLALRGAPRELELVPFTREETEKFLVEGFGIRNSDFQHQIWRLSKGNARLATMAAKLALENRTFAAITDLTRLYDAYYRPPIERADRQGATLMPVLALLSVLKSFRVDAIELISSLERTFGWREGSLWETVLELHRLECVDLHRNRIVRVSDQILATYAFFLVFVERRTLSFRKLVELCGVRRLDKINDVMSDIHYTMDRQRIRSGLDDDVNDLLRGADSSFRLKLLQVFWYFDPEFALSTAAQYIEALPPSTNVSAFEEKARFDAIDVLAVLACFSLDAVRRPLAAHLAMRFLAKQPSQGGAVLSLLTEMHGFGIHRYSDGEGFQAQKDVVDVLRSELQASEIARDVLIRYAAKMLRTEFEGSFSDGARVTISRIRLTSGIAGPAYRNSLWECLLDCSGYSACTERLHLLLWDYARHGRGDSDVRPVLSEDLPFVTRLFLAIASADRPADCTLATALHRRFLSVGLEGFVDVAGRFESEVNQLRRLAATDWDKAAEGHEAEESERRNCLIHAYSDWDASKIVRLFLSATEAPDDGKHELLSAWQFLLDHWAAHDPTKLLDVTELAIQGQMAVTFHTYGWVGALLRGCGKETTRTAIAAAAKEVWEPWQQAFLTSLPANEISDADVEDFLAMLGRRGSRPAWIGHLSHYVQAAPRFLPRLIQVLLGRDDGAMPISNVLNSLGGSELDLVRQHFCNEPELLARAYLEASIADRGQSHFDHAASLFDLLLDLRPGFINEYVQARVLKEQWISRFSENHRDYSRLWKRPDWASRLVELLEALTSAGVRTHDEYFRAWLPAQREHGTVPAHVLDHLLVVVHRYAEHVGMMKIVFSGMSDLDEDQRLKLLSVFLAGNQDLDGFKALPLLSNHLGGSGSLVPVLQARVRFLERVLQLMTTPPLIGHRMHVAEEMRDEQWRVEAEVESDFVDPDRNGT